jgi:hypothetical protein
MANSRIHHTHLKQAEQLGVILEPAELGVKATWPEHGKSITGPDAKEALARIKAIQAEYYKEEPTTRIEVVDHEFKPFEEDKPHKINKIPTHGGEAFRQGYMAADCPFLEEDVEFDAWNEEFDAAADAPTPQVEEEEEKKPVSVVKMKYRAIYAERGTPTTCNDELAQKLDNLVKNAKGTNIEYFDMIMAANEVDMSKYSRTTPGWQGRYRMTGRNMLAKKVHANGGLFKVPNGVDMQMSADWMSQQRFQR